MSRCPENNCGKVALYTLVNPEGSPITRCKTHVLEHIASLLTGEERLLRAIFGEVRVELRDFPQGYTLYREIRGYRPTG